MRNRPIPQKRDVFCIFLTKTSLFPFGFKNDFYVICALTAVLVEYVMSDDRSFQSVDHSSEIETAVMFPLSTSCAACIQVLLTPCSRRSAYRPLATGENCPL